MAQTIYKSDYTDRPIKPAQKITELICEVYAQKHNKSLPWQFWKLDEWCKLYQLQIIHANALLKVFSHQAIINALLSDRAKTIYSLKNHRLIDIIKDEQKNIDKELDMDYNIKIDEKTDVARESFNSKNKSLASKLD